MCVLAVSTSSSGGNQVDGLPPVASDSSTQVSGRVILFAPVAVLLQSWAGHKCRVGTLQSHIARDKTDGFSIRARYSV